MTFLLLSLEQWERLAVRKAFVSIQATINGFLIQLLSHIFNDFSSSWYPYKFRASSVASKDIESQNDFRFLIFIVLQILRSFKHLPLLVIVAIAIADELVCLLHWEFNARNGDSVIRDNNELHCCSYYRKSWFFIVVHLFYVVLK